MPEWTIGDVVDAIAEAVPDREMTVCGTRRTTFAQGADRTRRIAKFLAGHGLGAHRERGGLNRWECGLSLLARFKTPKGVLFVDQIRRLGNGKADYRWAKGRAAQRVEMA